MTCSFNVLDEAWIPCVMEDGSRWDLSTRAVLKIAHEVNRVSAEYAPMTASILHFLLAVLYSCRMVKDEQDWETIWQKGAFEAEMMEPYLSRWQQRFDLFDHERPFYQDQQIGIRSKDLHNLKGKKPQEKSINDLILHAASGSIATLFDHHSDEQRTCFSAPQTACLLLMVQGFSLGGMTSASIGADKFYADSAHARGAVFFLRGKNLFESLMLNLIADSHWDDFDHHQDQPAWEMDDPLAPERRKPQGIRDLLTWHSRRMLLVPGENEKGLCCEKIFICPGLSLAEEFENPFYSIFYKDSQKGEQQKKLVRFSENKALWRDSHTLLEVSNPQQKRFKALDWFNHLLMNGYLSGQILVNAYGLCTEPGKKKAFFYKEESLSFPSDYLRDEYLRNNLFRCIDLVDGIRNTLWGAICMLVEKFLTPDWDETQNKKPDPAARDALMRHVDAEQILWDGLQLPFQSLVFELPADEQKAIANWNACLRQAAVEAFEQARQSLGASTPALMAGAAANRRLRAGLKKTFDTSEK